ncbi:MAG TPA: energy transducer TonB [Thermoanaerobaculia bacterium]|jgi:protein TonB|nr:energy transducer TonB [Thermoanaerobaculia bacterium]
MSDRKPCVQCGRTIDGYARICPFCNWDQSAPVPAAKPHQTVASDYTPPSDETKLRKYALGAGGGLLMVIVLFFVGAHVHGRNPPPVTSTEQAAPSGPATSQQRSNVALVPDNGPAPPSPGQPVTSAPVSDTAQGLANQTDRTDATAASSVQYSQMAQRAAAEASRKKVSGLVDPLTIQGNAYGNPLPRPMTSSSNNASSNAIRRAALRTPPVPEYQGLPDIGVRGYASARLLLTIGTDGRVHGVNVIQPLPGATPQLLEAVQAWRFKPATENGTPVPSTFMTSLQFRPR